MVQTQTSNYTETSKLTLEPYLGTGSWLPASVDLPLRYACTSKPSIVFEKKKKALWAETVPVVNSNKRVFDFTV